MFILARTLDEGGKQVILNAAYIKRIEQKGIVVMADSVRKYKAGADAIQRLLDQQYTIDVSNDTQYFTRQIAEEITKEDE